MAKLDKICFRILSVSIVLTMYNIEPAMAEVNISDLLRHVVMSSEAYESNDPELKKLTFFLEQEQSGVQPHQLATIIRIVPISYITYSRTSETTQVVAEATYEEMPRVAETEESRGWESPESDKKRGDILLSSVSPRAGPCC
ncbi:MAG: hypothetical protein MJZ15_07965 [Bacteroidales bacterium]|nr:hypothetical protein [Bacteroidales bacterium]